MPSSAMRSSISELLVAGPMVATILVRRVERGPVHGRVCRRGRGAARRLNRRAKAPY